MASNAARPSKLAPYPTLVGTATNGHVDEATDDTGEGALHAGDDDDGAGLVEAVDVSQEAMNAGDANVEDGVYVGTHAAGCDDSFLGDGNIRRSRLRE